MQDRSRIGEPGGLDHHAAEMRDLAVGPADEQVQQGVDDVAAYGAAQAAAVEQHDIVGGALDQEMVDADLAKFVDDDCGRRHLGLLQHVVQHGRLAAAEKAGQQGNRDQRRGFGRIHRAEAPMA